MTSQELSNMVFAIKEKITDKEYKDLMDKLSIKNEEEDCLYEFSYVEQRPITFCDDDDNIDKYYILKTKLRKKIIKKIVIETASVDLKDFIKNPPYYSHMYLYFNYTDETILHIGAIEVNSPSYFSRDCVNIDMKTDNGGSNWENGVWIQFQSIIPISLKKI